MSLGIESGNQRILDMIKKRLDKKLVKGVVSEIKKAGIQSVGFFMIGFPTETKEEIKETINFACSLDLDRAAFGKATPLPGTALYDIWIEKYSKNENINWKTFNYNQFYADWSECTPKKIAKLQIYGFFKFYLTKFRFIKVLFSLKKSQIILFLKRVLKVILTTEIYNFLFVKRKGEIKIINPAERNI